MHTIQIRISTTHQGRVLGEALELVPAIGRRTAFGEVVKDFFRERIDNKTRSDHCLAPLTGAKKTVKAKLSAKRAPGKPVVAKIDPTF